MLNHKISKITVKVIINQKNKRLDKYKFNMQNNVENIFLVKVYFKSSIKIKYDSMKIKECCTNINLNCLPKMTFDFFPKCKYLIIIIIRVVNSLYS